MMCLIHDIPEIRIGDQNSIHKKYVKDFELQAIKDQLKNLVDSKYLHDLFLEFKERKTKESIVAKDADILDEVLLLKEYALTGNKEAERWLKNKYHFKFLKTKSAKSIHSFIIKTNPSDWWDVFVNS